MGLASRRHNKEWWGLGSRELIPSGTTSTCFQVTNLPYVEMQPGLLSLQEQNSRLLHKISLFYSWRFIICFTYFMGPNKIYPGWNSVQGPPFGNLYILNLCLRSGEWQVGPRTSRKKQSCPLCLWLLYSHCVLSDPPPY